MWPNLKKYFSLDRATLVFLMLFAGNVIVAKISDGSKYIDYICIAYTIISVIVYLWYEVRNNCASKFTTYASAVLLAIAGWQIWYTFATHPLDSSRGAHVGIVLAVFTLYLIICQHIIIIFYGVFANARNKYSLVVYILTLIVIIYSLVTEYIDYKTRLG